MIAAALVVGACSSGSTSTTVTANGASGAIPCPGSGCVGGFVFTCDSDGNASPGARCNDAGPVDAAADAD